MKTFMLVLALAGCDSLAYTPEVGHIQNGGPDGGEGDGSLTPVASCDDSDPHVAVSFFNDIRPLTTRDAAGCGCHLGFPTSGFDIGTYDSLRRGGAISGTNIIIPGKPCQSILPQKLGVAPPYGSRMPYNGPPYWTSAELQLLRDWIAEGALDN